MNQWSKEQFEEMFGNDIIGQLEFLAGCYEHRLNNVSTIPNGWIVPDEALENLVKLVVQECCDIVNRRTQHNNPNDCLTVLDIKEHFGIE